jgi:hypothetical protein
MQQNTDNCRLCGSPLGCVVYRVAQKFDICERCFDDCEEIVDQVHAIAAFEASEEKETGEEIENEPRDIYQDWDDPEYREY